MKSLYTLLLSRGQLLIILLATGTLADDVPVAPILPKLNQGWEKSFRLQNDFLDVVVDPETGRMAYISYQKHENVFALGTNSTARSVLGGETVYPLAREQFKTMQLKAPGPDMVNGPWEGRAWVSVDGTQICQLTKEYPAPLDLKCSRKIILYQNEPAVHVRQRVERTGRNTQIPATLWNVARLQAPSRVVLPLDPGDASEKQLRPFEGALEKDTLTFSPAAAVFKPGKPSPTTLGTESARQWVAAELNDLVVIARTLSESGIGAFPNNCTARMHVPATADYVELETFSRRRRLDAGEQIENTFMLEFHLIEKDLADEKLAQTIGHLLGEAPKPDKK